MADTYARKGLITLSEAKSMLSVDDTFTSLTDSQKTLFINDAIQEVANLRNLEGKEDYNDDNVGDPNLIKAQASKLAVVTDIEMTALAGALLTSDVGYTVFNTDKEASYTWSGTAWV